MCTKIYNKKKVINILKILYNNVVFNKVLFFKSNLNI